MQDSNRHPKRSRLRADGRPLASLKAQRPPWGASNSLILVAAGPNARSPSTSPAASVTHTRCRIDDVNRDRHGGGATGRPRSSRRSRPPRVPSHCDEGGSPAAAGSSGSVGFWRASSVRGSKPSKCRPPRPTVGDVAHPDAWRDDRLEPPGRPTDTPTCRSSTPTYAPVGLTYVLELGPTRSSLPAAASSFGCESAHDAMDLRVRTLVVRHVTIFGRGHGLQRAIIDESQHRTPERLIMAQH